jgi:hypothetical protein
MVPAVVPMVHVPSAMLSVPSVLPSVACVPLSLPTAVMMSMRVMAVALPSLLPPTVGSVLDLVVACAAMAA